jgi:hypothetical protein
MTLLQAMYTFRESVSRLESYRDISLSFYETHNIATALMKFILFYESLNLPYGTQFCVLKSSDVVTAYFFQFIFKEPVI